MTDIPRFELQPTLVGTSLSLRPLLPGDLEGLFAVASDPLVWEQHPEPERCQRPVFEKFFAKALESGGALAAVLNATGRVVGSSRYYDLAPDGRSVVVGYTFLTRELWGGAANREMKDLMLRWAFRWVDVVWFHVAASNLRSRKAVEKLGALLDHEEEKTMGGRPVVHAIYRLEAARWPSGPR
jgi:RimJ/RimL family protein N-acetyltransferase